MTLTHPTLATVTQLHPPKRPVGCFGLGWANAVSVGRMGLAVVLLVLLLNQPSRLDYTIAFWGTIAVIWLDGIDGYLARKLNETSPSGAMIDILADRAVELLYWIAFAGLGWVSVAVPMIVAVRGVWVDGLRSLALQQGFTAFGDSSLMKSPVGILLVSSRFSRWTYAFVKAVAFSFLIAIHGWQWSPWVHTFTEVSVWLAVAFCVIRGLPVLIEARRFLN